jgi:hypothetical protein
VGQQAACCRQEVGSSCAHRHRLRSLLVLHLALLLPLG